MADVAGDLPQAVVEVRTELDPVARAIDDARALAYTHELPEAVARRVVPGFCRIALEAACVEAIRRRRLGRGDRAEDVEKALDRADKLTKKAALALFDDEHRGAEVLARLGAFGGARARDVYQRCNRGAHEPIAGSLATFVDDAAELARNLRRQA